MQKTFAAIVQQIFQFLIDEFGFVLVEAIESPRDHQWEGKVEYKTRDTLINLSCTRGEAPTLLVGRARDEGKHKLPIQVIYEFSSLSSDEKTIVLSVSDNRQAAAVLVTKQLVARTQQTPGTEEKLRSQLTTYAGALREHALPFLRGDFTQWLEIWEYHIEKLTVENRRAGRPDSVPVVVTNEKGQFQVIGKQPVFKKGLDYIKELRDEREL